MSAKAPSRPGGAEIVQWGGERARVGPWRGDGAVAQLTPIGNGLPTTEAFVRRCLAKAGDRGYSRVVTGAHTPLEGGAFRAAGFEVEQRLHLLRHDLRFIPVAPDTSARSRLRRTRPGDRARVLDLDSTTFPPFWRLGDAGLRDAVEATPAARFRVAVVDGDIAGYAVTGRAGRHGYLQRLAVDPQRQRAGLGSALALDGLRWLARWRATSAVVNTQVDNDGAVALYERLGFRREPLGLCVLALDLRP
jgi:ribosomal protein S18 acetylase RimI-like enzyme